MRHVLSRFEQPLGPKNLFDMISAEQITGTDENDVFKGSFLGRTSIIGGLGSDTIDQSCDIKDVATLGTFVLDVDPG